MLELTYKRILIIALPLMFGTFVQSMITITDGAFVSEIGNTAYNAVGQGSLMYFALFMLCRGLADGAQISIAKLLGEKKDSDIGALLLNAQVGQLFLSTLIFIIFLTTANWFIDVTTKTEELNPAIKEFIQYRSWGIFFAGLQVSMMAFFIGLGKTRIILFSTVLMAICNIFLDYCLIFGNCGLPELGMKGAPIASCISEMIAFLFLMTYAIKSRSFKVYQYNLKRKIQSSKILALFQLSYPLMGQGLISLSTWWVFFGLIEHMGPDNLEIAHNIRYMYFIAFIPIFGYASATRTYVSNLVGRKEQHLIPKIQMKIALLSVLSLFLLFHGSLLYPDQLIKIVEHNPNASSELLETSADALRFISGSILLFALAIVPFNSVAALGKTKTSFLIELVNIIIYLSFAYFSIKVWQWDIISIWWVEYLYFGGLAIFSLVYLRYYFKQQRAQRTTESNI